MGHFSQCDIAEDHEWRYAFFIGNFLRKTLSFQTNLYRNQNRYLLRVSPADRSASDFGSFSRLLPSRKTTPFLVMDRTGYLPPLL